MNRVVAPGSLSGSFRAPASKSHAHRLLICAALGTAPVTVLCDTFSDDILATIDCLTAMGAQITHEESRISVTPVFASRKPDGLCKLPCRESGALCFAVSAYRLRLRISAVTFAMNASSSIVVVSPLRSRTEMLPASASLAPRTSI